MWLKKLQFLTIISFCSLGGCQTFQVNHFFSQRPALIGIYPEQMPDILSRKRVVLVGGVFDIVHYGHLSFFKAAKQQGDHLIVALEPDSFIKQHKHRKPVHTQMQRAELLSQVDVIDEVILLPPMQGYKDYLTLVETIRPHVIAVTEEDPHKALKERQASHVGAEVIAVVGRNSTFSTSQILKHGCGEG